MTQNQIVELAIQGHASTRDAIRWAMQQERESCAKLIEDYKYWLGKTAKEDISNAIRARSKND